METPPASPTPELKYWAFISYSHADAKWGDWLHEAIETYRVPKRLVGRSSRDGAVPARLFPVFRDREELAGSARLDDNLKSALASARYLIVICSPQAAASRWVNAEVQSFKALGREDRVLTLIIGGEPNAAPDSGLLECFPKAVRHRVDAQGELTEEHTEAIAADAREGKDGRAKALLKLLAGLLDVGFDELYRRDRQRQARARLRLLAAGFLGLLGLMAIYWFVADAGTRVPGGEALRAVQDRHHLSLLRPVHSEARVREAAGQRRAELTAMMRDRLLPQKWIRPEAPNSGGTRDLWSHAQALTALLRPRQGGEELGVFHDSIGVAFAAMDGEKPDAAKLEWGEAKVDKSVPVFWTAAYLSQALGTPGLLTPAEHARQLRNLEALQRLLNAFNPLNDGGWNLFPAQRHPDHHHLYSSALALLTLSELRRSGLGWEGDIARRDAMTVATAQWLTALFDATGQPPGWRGLREDNREVYDGLTLQIYGQLLRVQEARLGYTLPPAIAAEIPKFIASCAQRNLGFPTDGGEFEAFYTPAGGQEVRGHEAIKYLWYPWAIDCAMAWLDYARSAPVPREQFVQVRRALGHLVVDLGAAAVGRAGNEWTFVGAETLYGLSAVPRD